MDDLQFEFEGDIYKIPTHGSHEEELAWIETDRVDSIISLKATHRESDARDIRFAEYQGNLVYLDYIEGYLKEQQDDE